MFAWVGSIITKLPGFRPKVTPKKELVIRNVKGKPVTCPNMTISCFEKKFIQNKYLIVQLQKVKCIDRE